MRCAKPSHLTKIPMIKDAAERSATRIVTGQNPHKHLWNYNFNPGQRLQNPGERNDLSYVGWCMQALKAADVAGLEVEGLTRRRERAIEGMKMNFRQTRQQCRRLRLYHRRQRWPA